MENVLSSKQCNGGYFYEELSGRQKQELNQLQIPATLPIPIPFLEKRSDLEPEKHGDKDRAHGEYMTIAHSFLGHHAFVTMLTHSTWAEGAALKLPE